MKPTIGRIVHYVVGSAHHAAVIAHVFTETCVNLAVFDFNGTPYSRTSVAYSEEAQDGSWHWPERD